MVRGHQEGCSHGKMPYNPFLMASSEMHKAEKRERARERARERESERARERAREMGRGIQVMHFHNDIKSVGSRGSSLHNVTETAER